MNNITNNVASDWTETLVDERHTYGKVSGTEWRMGVWNVRGINKYKEREVLNVMNSRNLDILCVPETKRKGQEVMNTRVGGLALWSGVMNETHGKQGIGLILNERAKQHVKSYSCVSPRLLWVRMKVGIRRLFVVACYAPVNGECDNAKDAFWDSVSDAIGTCDPGERIILLGDMNGWVGVQRRDTDRVLGRFGDSKTNGNGDKLISLCLENRLFITNTWFKHRLIHMYTWGRGESRSMIDFIVADERLRALVKDTKVMRGAECGTDHYLVVSKMSLGQGWRKKPIKKLKLTRVKVEKLQKPEVQIEYRDKLTEYFYQQRLDWERELEKKNVEGAWILLRDVIMKSATEVCGTSVVGKMTGDAWWNDEIRVAVSEKKQAYLRKLNVIGLSNEEKSRTENNYKDKKRRVKKLVKESKEKIRREEDMKMQNDFEGNKKLFWKWVKKARKGSNAEIIGIKNKDGEMVWDVDRVKDCMSDYFKKLYGSEGMEENNGDMDVTENRDENDEIGISVINIQSTIRKLKNGKAAGVDGITAEMLKGGGECLYAWMSELMSMCSQNGKVPSDWRKAIIVPLYKGKGDKGDCTNYRAISLLSIPGKVFSKILIEKVMEITAEKIWEVQCGFMPGRSCADQIFSLRQIIEKSLRVGKKVFCAFVDLEKAFDMVDRVRLWEALKEYGVKGQLLQAIKAIYENSKASVRINGQLSDWFNIGQGVRQGCVMSAWLFIIFMDKCLRMALLEERGVDLGTVQVRGLTFADDEVLTAESEADLQRMLSKLNDSAKIMGLKINVNKTKIVVFEKKNERTVCNITLNEGKLEQVEDFVYLGSLFSADGSLDGEILRRINEGRKVIGSVGAIARSNFVSNKAKMAIYDSILAPTVLYGSETWTCQIKDRRKVDAVGMRFLRNICGKTLLDKVSNEWVLKECGVEETLIDKSERNLLRWFGHVERMDEGRLTKQVYVGKVNGCVPRGRPRKEWRDYVNETLKRKNIKSQRNRRTCMTRCMDVEEAKFVCQDRNVWRKIVYKDKKGVIERTRVVIEA